MHGLPNLIHVVTKTFIKINKLLDLVIEQEEKENGR